MHVRLSATTLGTFMALSGGPQEPAAKAEHSPEGLWLTVDDRTGEPRSEVRIAVEGGRLRGTIVRIHPRPGESAEPSCNRCEGRLHGAPVVGMVILWGHLARAGRWVDGRVLDPESGREYASSVWLEGPDSLRVRGRWGPFFRTQTWRRVETAEQGEDDREEK